MPVRSTIAGWFLLLSLGFWLVAPGIAEAQLPIGNLGGMKNAYEGSKARRDVLKTGAEKAGPKDAAVANAVAEWHIYRITHKTEAPLKVQDEFTREINDLMDKKSAATKRVYIDQLGVATVEAMKAVLARDIMKDPQMTVHAAQMLPTMAKLKQDQVNAFLSGLIEDSKTHDAVRLHALKALKEAMPVRQQLDMVIRDAQQNLEDFKDAGQNLIRARDAKNVDALTKYIERMVKVDNMQPEDIAAVRFLRREAIVSLSAAGSPAVTAHVKAPKSLDGPVAPTLMRVIAKKGGISPPPNLPEKIEAALGLCALEYPNMPEYNAELAIYAVGQAILDFANEYNKDWGNFARVNLKEKLAPYHGYKAEGKRLQTGLDQLITNAAKGNNIAAKRLADELKLRAKPLLDKMVTYEQTEPARVEELSRFVSPPAGKSLTPFKTLKSAVIPLD